MNESTLQVAQTDLTLKTEITKQAATLKQIAVELMITDQTTYDLAGTYRNELKPWYKRIDDHCSPIIKQKYKEHQDALAQKKQLSVYLDEVDSIIHEKIKKYLQAQHKKNQEKIRQDREAIEKANREAQEHALDKAIEKGLTDKAEAILSYDLPAPVMIAIQKTKSSESVEIPKWSVKILNSADVSREWCCPDEKLLTELANKNKGQNAPAGVEFVYEPTIKRK
jgi:hypothetical protein